jgi:hypothetical protein
MKKRFRFYVFFIFFCYIIIYIPDFTDPLEKSHIEKGLTNWSLSERQGEPIHMIIERRGDDAGEIGYFYVQMQSGYTLIVPADARLPLNDKSTGGKNYLDYYTYASFRGSLPKYDNTLSLRITSLKDWILNRKNANQRWWAYYLET